MGLWRKIGDSILGARSRYIAFKHLLRMSREAPGKYPQVACLSFDVISASIAVDGRFELEELDALARLVFPKLSARRLCLDIGANIGNHALFFADHFEQVLAFEPHPRLYPLLSYNAELAETVRVFDFGLSDAAAHVEAAGVPGNIGMSRIGRTGAAGAVVQFAVKRLDDVPEVQALERIDFIKIDVEGHEPAVIRGARDTLLKHRPVVALEVLKDEIEAGSSPALDALRAVGYEHFHELRSQRPLAWAPKPVAKLATALAGLILDHRPPKNFTLEPVDRIEPRNYPMIIASMDAL